MVIIITRRTRRRLVPPPPNPFPLASFLARPSSPRSFPLIHIVCQESNACQVAKTIRQYHFKHYCESKVSCKTTQQQNNSSQSSNQELSTRRPAHLSQTACSTFTNCLKFNYFVSLSPPYSTNCTKTLQLSLS